MLRLCDYATAGSTGARYVSWLPAREIAPPAPVSAEPADGAAVPPGPIEFRWRRPAVADKERRNTLVIAETPDFQKPVLEVGVKGGHRLVVSREESSRLRPGVNYYWKIVSQNAYGTTASLPPAKRFHVDPSLPPSTADQLTEYGEGPDGIDALAYAPTGFIWDSALRHGVTLWDFDYIDLGRIRMPSQTVPVTGSASDYDGYYQAYPYQDSPNGPRYRIVAGQHVYEPYYYGSYYSY